MARLHSTSLFAGRLAAVTDVRCREPASPCGHEEHAGGHELVVVRSGVFVKHGVARGRTAVVAEPTHALLLNRHEPYRVSHPIDGGDDCTVLAFDDAAALEVAAAVDERARDRPHEPFGVAHARLTPGAALRVRALRRALAPAGVRAGPSSPTAHVDALAVEEEALRLLAELLREGCQARRRLTTTQGLRLARTRRARAELVERARLVLATRPGERWTLAALARETHSSPYHLTRVLREHAGLPAYQHLLALRLTLALERLDGGERNLSALALDLGFSSHSHFSTAFRRRFGVVPSEISRLTRRERRLVPHSKSSARPYRRPHHEVDRIV